MLKIIRVDNYKSFKECKDGWDELLSRSRADNIFLTYDWIDACIRHFFDEEKLLILNAYDNDRLMGIAPLMIRSHRYFGLPVKSVCFIGTGVSDRMDLIVDGERERIVDAVMGYLMDIRKEWDFIDLEEIPEGSGTFRAMEGYLAKNRIANIPGPSKKSFYIPMDSTKENVCTEFSRKFRKKLRKIENKWHGLNLNFERYTGSRIDEDRIFPELNSIEGRSWKGDERSGIFSKPASMEFHREIFSIFSKGGFLDLSVLNLDSRPIAYIYNYLYGKRSYNYSIAYDKKYSSLSPGTLLMLWALADSSSKDIAEFDFARGEGNWKSRFAREFRIHNRVRVFKNNIYSGFLHRLQSGVMPYMRRIKFLHSLWMRSKGWLRWD